MNKANLKQALIDLEESTIEEAYTNYESFLTGNLLDRNEVVDLDDQSHHRASLDISDELDKSVHEHEGHLATINGISFEPTGWFTSTLTNSTCWVFIPTSRA